MRDGSGDRVSVDQRHAGLLTDQLRRQISLIADDGQRVVRCDSFECLNECLIVSEYDEAFAGTGIVVTGSVLTAGAARTLFGRDPA